MVKIYGIKNCDVVQKAIKWLEVKDVPYTFYNYKEAGLEKEVIQGWMEHMPVNKLINSRSTTFKELPASEKEGIDDKDKAIALMMKHTSIIKRPVWDLGNGKFFLGWDEKEIVKLLG